MKALIVDSEELFRLSLKEVTNVAARPHEILEASSERDFLSLTANEEKLGLIIIHLATLGREGHDCLRLARRLYPDSALLVIDEKQPSHSHEENRTIRLARSASVAQMIVSIRRAMGLPFDNVRTQDIKGPNIHNIINETSRETESSIDLSRLSFRQKQILAMAADGLPNKEIAARLEIAEGTVKAHMHAIFKVMGVSNRTQAVIRFGAAGPAQNQVLQAVGA